MELLTPPSEALACSTTVESFTGSPVSASTSLIRTFVHSLLAARNHHRTLQSAGGFARAGISARTSAWLARASWTNCYTTTHIATHAAALIPCQHGRESLSHDLLPHCVTPEFPRDGARIAEPRHPIVRLRGAFSPAGP